MQFDQECNEENEYNFSVLASNSAQMVQVARRSCRLIDLSVNLPVTAPADLCVLVLDVSAYDGQNAFAEVTNNFSKMLKLPPMWVSPGTVVSWTPKTRWTRFDSGILVLVSTTEDVTGLSDEPFGVFHHVMYPR